MEESAGLENLAAIVLRQTNASQLASLQRAQPLNEAQIVQVGELMANMMAGYPHQALEMSAEVFQLAFEDLAKIFGVQQLETALRTLLTTQKFFPHPSEVREVLDEMAKRSKTEAEAEMKRNLPKIGCETCDGSGLVISLDTHGERVAKECECKLAWRRAKKQWEARREVKA